MKTLGLLLIAACSCAAADVSVRYVGKTKYLNNAKAVVTHSIDDSTKYVPDAIDALDKYGIKATLFISTDEDPAPEERFLTQLLVKDLWPRLRQAIDNGHEIGSHSQTHPCRRPETEQACSAAYTDAEVFGSRDQILKRTQQPYVWTWCYPCGTCANLESIQKKIAAAGYIVARNYPDEPHDGHIAPDLQTWDANPLNAAYTQVVQKRGGAARSEVLDLDKLDSKFDEIYAKGGIYNFMSHPQWLDFGPNGFYEKHLAHIARKPDVWYVPMGPLYAYKTIYDRTEVKALSKSKFSITNKLNPKIYGFPLTLDFLVPSSVSAFSNGQPVPGQRREAGHLYVTVVPNTTIEFRSASSGLAVKLAMISLQGLSKAYETPAGAFQALQDVNLEIGAGQFVAIVGKSGSGKSTLLNLIGGIDRPSSGSVQIGGAAIERLSEHQLTLWRGGTVGFVFQFFQLLPTLTVAENVILPMDFRRTLPPAERRKRALELLDRVGVADQAHKLPAALSGGQQQRVAIARALANDPPVVLADEPTGNLDSQTGAAVLQLFGELARSGKTVVVVTHERDLAGLIDRTVELSDGRLVC